MEPDSAASKENFMPVPLAVMQAGTLAPVDLYIRVRPGRFTLYKKAQARLYEKTRLRLLDHGVKSLYLCEAGREAYHQYVEENIAAIVRDDLLPPQQACEIVYDTSSRVMVDVFDDPRSGRNLQRVHAVVEATVLSILKRPDSLWHMTALASHDYYTYTHCVHVGMFLVAGGREVLGISDPDQLRRIGLGGMLHDIGKSQIPDELLTKPSRLTPEEFELIREHPALGEKIARQIKRLPATAARIIRSHHEHLDGKGYPDALSGEQLSPIVRLAGIVDVYDALTTDRAYAAARSPYDALELMMNEMESQFDAHMLRSFVRFLGPKDQRQEDSVGAGRD